MTSGTSGQLALPALANAGRLLGLVGDQDRPDVLADRAADVDRLDDGPVDARHRHDDPLLALRPRDDDVRPDRELRADARYWRLMNSIIATRIGMTTATSSDVGALAISDDDGDDAGQHAAEAVDRQPPAPAATLARAASGGPCPPWLIVNDTNTPTEYSGMRAVVLPPKTTSRAIATTLRMTMPDVNARRSPRKLNWRGM